MTPRTRLLLACTAVAVAGASPEAGGWNDGSRLAAVESLAERGTWVIDDSVFVKVPPVEPGRPHPYAESAAAARAFGTLDKLQIGGHYYSDKSPVPSLLLAGPYRLWLMLGGPTAAERPDAVVRFLTLLSSGVAYLLAVAGVWRLGTRAGLSGRTLTLFGASFALATVAAAYSRHVNNHIVLLAVVAWVCVELQKEPRDVHLWASGVWLGLLAGFGYTIDLGAGPPLVLAVAGFLFWRTRSFGAVAAFGLAAFPWFALHHWLNYRIGGTFGPANAVSEYLAWPGSPFTAETMTGGLKHTPAGLLTYSLDLLVGQKGIVSNNLPLWLAAAGGVRLALWHRAERPVLLFAFGWCGAVWLLYALTSNNQSGQCVSVRWFVPFLAPGYWVLARLLARELRYAADLAWLSIVGAVMAAIQFWHGAWMPRMTPGLWGGMLLAGAGWAVVTARHARQEKPRSAIRNPQSAFFKRRSVSGA